MWAQLINVLIGVWIMFSPWLLSFNDNIADNQHITGPFIISIAIIAMSECVRNARFFNILTGIWLILSFWLLNFNDTAALINNSLAGILLIAFSLVKGRITRRYGGGWRSLLKQNPLHVHEANQQTTAC